MTVSFKIFQLFVEKQNLQKFRIRRQKNNLLIFFCMHVLVKFINILQIPIG